MSDSAPDQPQPPPQPPAQVKQPPQEPRKVYPKVVTFVNVKEVSLDSSSTKNVYYT